MGQAILTSLIHKNLIKLTILKRRPSEERKRKGNHDKAKRSSWVTFSLVIWFLKRGFLLNFFDKNWGMASLAQTLSSTSAFGIPQVHFKCLKLFKSSNIPRLPTFPHLHIRHLPIFCTKLSSWEPSTVAYAPVDKAGDNLSRKTTDIFETLDTDNNAAEATVTNAEELIQAKDQPSVELQLLKWPMWLLGPSLLLATGMVPTLWLPISSIFLGPNIASLLSLIGLDCIFNLGATLFLLMADSCARPKYLPQACSSKPPFVYQFWNVVATITGFIIPFMMLFGSQRGYLQPQLPFIAFAVLLGPYLLLLSVQILTEMLTWHWQSPVWLVTPVVYESYRILQLMRGLRLGAELSAPAWMLHTIRGLVSWWVLILGMQLMRVAWFAGFSARAGKKQPSALADG